MTASGMSAPTISASRIAWLDTTRNVPVSESKPHEDDRGLVRGWAFNDVDEVNGNERPELIA